MSAAISLKNVIQTFNDARELDGKDAEISGFGIHVGDMVFVEGTDIHWGDPVNTASKLGQDTAQNGTILITQQVYDAITCKGARFSSNIRASVKLDFTHMHVTVSKVKIDCYRVTSLESTVKEALTMDVASNSKCNTITIESVSRFWRS